MKRRLLFHKILPSGINLEKYNNKIVTSLTLVDVSEGMLEQAFSRVKSLSNLENIEVTLMKADATKELVHFFGTERFETVVDSFSLCVMGNTGASQCINQISKVVKRRDHGQVLLLENCRSDNMLLGTYQDLTANTAALAGGKGCLYNQNVGQMIRESGTLKVVDEVSYVAGLFRFYKCQAW